MVYLRLVLAFFLATVFVVATEAQWRWRSKSLPNFDDCTIRSRPYIQLPQGGQVLFSPYGCSDFHAKGRLFVTDISNLADDGVVDTNRVITVIGKPPGDPTTSGIPAWSYPDPARFLGGGTHVAYVVSGWGRKDCPVGTLYTRYCLYLFELASKSIVFTLHNVGESRAESDEYKSISMELLTGACGKYVCLVETWQVGGYSSNRCEREAQFFWFEGGLLERLEDTNKAPVTAFGTLDPEELYKRAQGTVSPSGKYELKDIGGGFFCLISRSVLGCRSLRKEIEETQKGHWMFSGTRHFILEPVRMGLRRALLYGDEVGRARIFRRVLWNVLGRCDRQGAQCLAHSGMGARLAPMRMNSGACSCLSGIP